MEIAGTRTPRAARGLRANFRKYWPYYVMALPGVVYLIIFKFVPMLGCVIAFEDYQVYKLSLIHI